MAKHRTHSVEFKRQVVQEFLGGARGQQQGPRGRLITRLAGA
jgi:hypothetical protein